MGNFREPILATRKRPRSGLTTVASRLPAGSDWKQGIEYRPEGCKAPDVTGICNVDPELLVVATCECNVWIYAPGGGLNAADSITLHWPGPAGVSAPQLVNIDDNTIQLDFDCLGGFNGLVIEAISIQGNAGPIYGTQAEPIAIPPVTITDVACEEGQEPPDFQALLVQPKSASSPEDVVSFNPFIVYSPDGCNDPWASNEELYARAQRELEMGLSALIARELLESSLLTNPNPSLSSEAVDVSGGVAVNWTAALAALKYNMQNAGYVGDIWIHMPTWLEPSFLASRAGQIELSTGLLYAGLSPAISDAGYSGLVAPDGSVVLADPGVSGWIYATGPVEWDAGPLLDDMSEASDNLSNDRFTVAERPAIVRFDPCHVFAALVEATCAC